MLSHYHTAIDPGGENNSHASMLRMVGFNKRTSWNTYAIR